MGGKRKKEEKFLKCTVKNIVHGVEGKQVRAALSLLVIFYSRMHANMRISRGTLSSEDNYKMIYIQSTLRDMTEGLQKI